MSARAWDRRRAKQRSRRCVGMVTLDTMLFMEALLHARTALFEAEVAERQNSLAPAWEQVVRMASGLCAAEEPER